MLTMLMYHRILPQEHPEAVSVPMFRRQLDYLQRHYQILAPEEVPDYVHGRLRDAPRPYAALSFDDGWLDNWLFATEILKARGLRRHWRCPPGISMKVPSAKRNPMKS